SSQNFRPLMSDLLNTSNESIEVIEDDGSVASSSQFTSKPSSLMDLASLSSTGTTDGTALRGNALYARLAVLMGTSVSKEAALKEMKDMTKQITDRKKSSGVREIWDAGEEMGDGGTTPTISRPPLKRTGPPTAVVTGTANRLLASPARPAIPDKRKDAKSTSGIDKSSSGSEESNDASSIDRARTSSSETPKASSKFCIVCHDSSNALMANPLLTCTVCTLPTHARCAKPQIDKEEFASLRFVFTCSSCNRRPRSESPKPRSIIQITAPHDKRKKNEDSPKLSKLEQAKRKRLEEQGDARKKKSEEL
ncbi:hypothetical protein PFISCL1PPCAC_761, partial [Pristionchus fissidentatus]